MKTLPIIFLVACTGCLTGCLKDNPSVDFSTVKTIIEILPPVAGLEYFDNTALDLSAGGALDNFFVVNIASPKTLSKALTVTMAVNDSARTAYNNENTTDYEAMPDSAYTFSTMSGSIPAGQRLDTFNIVFHADKINPSKSYMLPVSIKDAEGQTISGNFNTIYYHTDAQ